MGSCVYLSFTYVKGFFAVQGHSKANLVCITVNFLLSGLPCNFWRSGDMETNQSVDTFRLWRTKLD